MRLLLSVIVLAASVLGQQQGDSSAPAWELAAKAGKAAFSIGNYGMAAQRYADALRQAEAEPASNEQALIPILQALATAYRMDNKAAEAQEVLERLLGLMFRQPGDGLPTANVLSDLALVQRSRDLRKEAAKTIQHAIALRKGQPEPMTVELGRDLTLAGTLQREIGEAAPAKLLYMEALQVWGALPDSGLMILTALDPLAALYRDESAYAEAEALYLRALRMREAAVGPKDAELIGTLDSLAYVQFGSKKYPEAEEAYKRLLEIWELVGNVDHPMVALTLDKMAVFYLEQKRFEDAEAVTTRAMGIRANALVESSRRVAKALAGQRKVEEAADSYERTLRIAADLRLPDSNKPVFGTLVDYSQFLRDNQKDARAAAIGRRIRESMQGVNGKSPVEVKPVPKGAKRSPSAPTPR